jgi:hypothetical protein
VLKELVLTLLAVRIPVLIAFVLSDAPVILHTDMLLAKRVFVLNDPVDI